MQKQKFKNLDILTFKKVSSLFAWNYKTSFHGSWMEFQDIRTYALWDDVKSIDWLSTAKQDKVYIKKYQEERELPSLFLFNLWGSMQFWFWKRAKIDTAIEAFLLLSLSSVKNWDSVWWVFYNDELFEYLEWRKWQLNLWKMIKKLENFKENNIDESANLRQSLKFLFSKKIKNNIIFIFTDELDVENSVHLKALCTKNDVILIHISDSFENNLSWSGEVTLAGKKSFFSFNSSRKTSKSEYLVNRKESIDKIKKCFLANWWSFIALDDNSQVFKSFYNFFKLRQKNN
ncbi:MAG: von Willebrand factor type A [uncultured bacterium (gcode 4)]|uniref:von Willebrand factor type A n=1 Tax=uncultured bacterium (gcode 4) TaxID=1234023 RepID=K2FGQ2_9BACT|nr:MAG: von Willebrand factor type A [uncultured bacterium (gcode 4)]